MEYYATFLNTLNKKEALLFIKCLESKYWGTCSNEMKLLEYCLYYLKPKFNLEYKHLNPNNLAPRKTGEEEERMKQENIVKALFSDWYTAGSIAAGYSRLKTNMNEIIADFELFLWIKSKDVNTKIEREMFLCRYILSNEKILFENQRTTLLEKKLASLEELIDSLKESETKAYWHFELNRIIYFYHSNYKSTSRNNNTSFFASLLNMLYTHSSKHLITHISQQGKTKVSVKLQSFCHYLQDAISSQGIETNRLADLYAKLLPYYMQDKEFATKKYFAELEANLQTIELEDQANLMRVYHNITFEEYQKDISKIDNLFVVVKREIEEDFIFTSNSINEIQLFPLIDILDEYFLLRGNGTLIKSLANKLHGKIEGEYKILLKLYLDIHKDFWSDKSAARHWKDINVINIIDNQKVEVRKRLLQIKMLYAKSNVNKNALLAQINLIDRQAYPRTQTFLENMEKLAEFKIKGCNQNELDSLAIQIEQMPYFLYKIYLLAQIKKLGGSRNFPPKENPIPKINDTPRLSSV